MSIDLDMLVEAALNARERAYAPYSEYHVGSAVLADNGKVYVGANVENASYGLSVCAERNAINAAVLDGAKRITAVAVATESDPPAAPCGMCRQTIAEFTGGADVPVALVNPAGDRRDSSMHVLLPLAFTPSDLE